MSEALPGIRATVVEFPTIVPITRRFIEEAEAIERVEAVEADVVNGSLTGSYDAAVMRLFLQVLSADEARRAIANTAEVMRPRGVLYILGWMLDDSRLSPPQAVVLYLAFMNTYDEGQSYTVGEHFEWLTEAGFHEFDRVTLPNGVQHFDSEKD